MNSDENMLLEAVKNMLSDKAQLGLSIHKPKISHSPEMSHMVQFHYQDIEDRFRIKLNNPKITMYESLSGAFYHTHSYMNIDHPQFEISFRKQMDGMVIPHNEQDLAIKYLEELRKETQMAGEGRPDWDGHNEFTNSDEQTIGYTNLNDLRKVSGHEA